MRIVIHNFGQRRIDPIPMCPEKLCGVTPLWISGINPTLIDPTPIDPSLIDPTLMIDPTPIDPNLMINPTSIDPILIDLAPIRPRSIRPRSIWPRSIRPRSIRPWLIRPWLIRPDPNRSDPVTYSHLQNINNLFETIFFKYYFIEFFIIFKIMGHFYDINIQTKDLRAESVIQTFSSEI